jgi:hypothetical protein
MLCENIEDRSREVARDGEEVDIKTSKRFLAIIRATRNYKACSVALAL